eukprot:5929184-Prymnesium_polylepis.1
MRSYGHVVTRGQMRSYGSRRGGRTAANCLCSTCSERASTVSVGRSPASTISSKLACTVARSSSACNHLAIT